MRYDQPFEDLLMVRDMSIRSGQTYLEMHLITENLFHVILTKRLQAGSYLNVHDKGHSEQMAAAYAILRTCLIQGYKAGERNR